MPIAILVVCYPQMPTIGVFSAGSPPVSACSAAPGMPATVVSIGGTLGCMYGSVLADAAPPPPLLRLRSQLPRHPLALAVVVGPWWGWLGLITPVCFLSLLVFVKENDCLYLLTLRF